jgi:ribosomal protein S18 acetylase RimI-like enzyme
MVSVQIRRANLEDVPGIVLVNVRSWQKAYAGIVPEDFLNGLDRDRPAREQRWRESLQRPSPETVFVAADPDERVIGYSRGRASSPPHFGHDAELTSLYLLPEAWGQGLGGSLVVALARSLAAGGHRSLLTWVLRENLRAVRFYERYGWRDISALTEAAGKSIAAKIL